VVDLLKILGGSVYSITSLTQQRSNIPKWRQTRVTGGAVEIEYRIPVLSLNGKYAYLAKKLIPARHSKNPYAVPVTRQALKGLTVLSKKTGKSTSELVEEWVQEELERSFAHEP
jgi:hypothetical protein